MIVYCCSSTMKKPLKRFSSFLFTVGYNLLLESFWTAFFNYSIWSRACNMFKVDIFVIIKW